MNAGADIFVQLSVWLINSMFGFHRIYNFLEFLNSGLKFNIFHRSPLD